MRLVRFEHDGSFLVASDSPWLGSQTLVLKDDAVRALQPIWEANGELLPVRCADAALHVFNATRVIDGLDESAAELVRFRNSERVMRITKYAFHSEALRDVDCFKIPQFRASPLFLSERFVDLWSAARLRGLEFGPSGTGRSTWRETPPNKPWQPPAARRRDLHRRAMTTAER